MKKGLHKLEHREFKLGMHGYHMFLQPTQRFFSTLLHGKREHLVMSEEDAAAMRVDQEPETLHQSLIPDKSSLRWWHILLALLLATGIRAMVLLSR